MEHPDDDDLDHTVLSASRAYNQSKLSSAIQLTITYTINNLQILKSCLDVEPAVNAALMEAANYLETDWFAFKLRVWSADECERYELFEE